MSATFSPLDIIIPVILVLYFIAGLRSGFFTTLGTFIGLALGVCAAAWLIPLAVAAVGSKWGADYRYRYPDPLPNAGAVVGTHRRPQPAPRHRYNPA